MITIKRRRHGIIFLFEHWSIIIQLTFTKRGNLIFQFKVLDRLHNLILINILRRILVKLIAQRGLRESFLFLPEFRVISWLFIHYVYRSCWSCVYYLISKIWAFLSTPKWFMKTFLNRTLFSRNRKGWGNTFFGDTIEYRAIIIDNLCTGYKLALICIANPPP